MANTVMQVLRTTTANKVPNTVNLPNAGQFALNMTDQVLYSRDTGTNIFAIGNNLPTLHVGNSSTSLLTVGNSSVNSLVVNTYISGNGFGITSVTATAAPGGANTQIQFNDSSSTGGDANLTWNKTSALLTVGNSSVNSAANTTAFSIGNTSGLSVTSPSLIIGNSTVNTFINSSAVLVNGSPVGGAPGGANTNIQFNDSGNLGGDATFTFDKTTDTVTIGNTTVNVTVNTSTVYIGAINTTAVGIQLTNSSIKIGNSSVNASINSTAFSGIANNSNYLGGEAANAFVQIKSFDVLLPQSGDSYTLFWTNCAITIAEIKTLVQNSAAATPWVNSSFYWGTSRASASNTILGNANTSNITTGTSTTSFTNATVAANSFVWCTLNGLSNATEFHASLRLS